MVFEMGFHIISAYTLEVQDQTNNDFQDDPRSKDSLLPMSSECSSD